MSGNLDAMEHNGRNHHGKTEADAIPEDGDSDDPLMPGDQKMWDKLDTL